jgi:hypothetical protein
MSYELSNLSPDRTPHSSEIIDLLQKGKPKSESICIDRSRHLVGLLYCGKMLHRFITALSPYGILNFDTALRLQWIAGRIRDLTSFTLVALPILWRLAIIWEDVN